MPDDAWDPLQYGRFRDERRAPFFDLIGLIRPRTRPRVIDLGCGTGELTRILHERLGAAETVGVDGSAAMLAESTPFAGTGVRFECRDLREPLPTGHYDVIFSNAALHWLEDHPGLFAQLSAALPGGGQLAVHMPANYDDPAHVTAAELAREPPYRAVLGDAPAQPGVLEPVAYAELLDRFDYRHQQVRLQVYAHRLPSRDDVVDWMKGALLVAYRQRLPAELWERFLADYRTRLLPRLADTRPFFFPFKRLLIWGERR